MLSLEQCTNRLGWLGFVAAILIFSPLAQAQQQEEEIEILGDALFIGTDEAPRTRPWLGLHCVPADATLRAHLKLPEGQGLVVGSVAEDSPAMKSGIQTNDILIKAGDQPLKEVSDLVKVLENSGNKPLAIELVRSGDSKTIEVTPGQRETSAPVIEPLAPGDRDVVRRWVERVREVAPLVEHLPERIRFFRPGIPVVTPFPEDLNLAITKEGDAPAKIMVSKGDEQWETTEDKLGDLPDSVRGPVEMFLGKLPPPSFTAPQPPQGDAEADPRSKRPRRAPRDRDGDQDIEDRLRDAESRARRSAADAAAAARRNVEEAERRVRDQAGPQIERFGRRIEQLEKQLRERLEKLDSLIEERTRAIEAVPAQPATPVKPAVPAEPAQPASGPTLAEPEEA